MGDASNGGRGVPWHGRGKTGDTQPGVVDAQKTTQCSLRHTLSSFGEDLFPSRGWTSTLTLSFFWPSSLPFSFVLAPAEGGCFSLADTRVFADTQRPLAADFLLLSFNCGYYLRVTSQDSRVKNQFSLWLWQWVWVVLLVDGGGVLL